METKAGERIIGRLKEAHAMAAGETPASRIQHPDHLKGAAAAYDSPRLRVVKLEKALETPKRGNAKLLSASKIRESIKPAKFLDEPNI